MFFKPSCAGALLLLAASVSAARAAPGNAEHIVVIVWDGMRPDFVTDQHAPNLAALARSGVFFANNQAVYPSSTNVNGVALATGDYPQHNGVLSNQEFRPGIDSRKPFDTADFPALDLPDGLVNRSFIAVPTLADLVQKAGFRTAIAGSKPVAQLFDRARGRDSPAARASAVIYRGRFLPTHMAGATVGAIGPFPKGMTFPNDDEDAWTTRALTDVLWKDGVPKFSLLWLSEPDLSQHEASPGSPTALAAIKSCDDNLGKTIAALQTRNAFASTDIFVVSDHGFSTIDLSLNAAKRLQAAGFDAVREISTRPKTGQILVVSLGGSMEFYVTAHDPQTIDRLVDFLQRSEFAGVIFTRAVRQGTFSFDQAQLDTPSAPDVLVASRWNSRPNKFGTPGQVASDIGKSLGEGTHTTLSPFDLHNILIVSGPDFRRGWRDQTPSGNIDLAPTILSLLGLPAPKTMDGRILTEALRDAKTIPAVERHELVAERNLGDSTWRQTLRLTNVGKTTYFLEGNGGRISTKR